MSSTNTTNNSGDQSIRDFAREAVAGHREQTEYERAAARPDAKELPGGVIELPTREQ